MNVLQLSTKNKAFNQILPTAKYVRMMVRFLVSENEFITYYENLIPKELKKRIAVCMNIS